jgi:hypothetical protein
MQEGFASWDVLINLFKNEQKIVIRIHFVCSNFLIYIYIYDKLVIIFIVAKIYNFQE